MKRSNTRLKLEEASFFQRHLDKHWRHIPQVDFYLSTFVSAARSVTWVMRYEYGKRPGWSEWFEEKKPEPHTRELLRKMNDVRVRSNKTEPIRTRTTAKVTISPDQITPELEYLLRDGGKEQFRLQPTDASNTQAYIMIGDRVLARATIDQAEHEIPEFEGRDAKDVCQDYLAELEALVSECERMFGLQPAGQPDSPTAARLSAT